MQISELLEKVDKMKGDSLAVTYYTSWLWDGNPVTLCSIADLKNLRNGMNELLDLLTEFYKETGEARLEPILKKFGRESDWCKLKGIEPYDYPD